METTGLATAIERLGTAEELVEVEQIVRRVARQLVQADGATFILREDDRCFYADEDAISPLWKGQRFPITQCISGWAMLNARTAIVPDVTEDDRIPLEAYRPTFVKSLLMVPVGQRRPTAAIGAYWARPRTATRDEVVTLEELAAATAVALERVGLDGAPYIPTSIRPSRPGSPPTSL